jgi:hypothetical protein
MVNLYVWIRCSWQRIHEPRHDALATKIWMHMRIQNFECSCFTVLHCFVVFNKRYKNILCKNDASGDQVGCEWARLKNH